MAHNLLANTSFLLTNNDQGCTAERIAADPIRSADPLPAEQSGADREILTNLFSGSRSADPLVIKFWSNLVEIQPNIGQKSKK